MRILVIGAGYAGLLFTMRLAGKVARQHVHIALVNELDTPGITTKEEEHGGNL